MLKSLIGATWVVRVMAVIAAVLWVWGPDAWAVSLPDHRAYELVSPSDKNGSDVLPDSARVRAAASDSAADPMAVSFASLGGFGDIRGMGIATDYMSIRSMAHDPGNSGWATHAITPPQNPLPYFASLRGQDSDYDGEFSPNLDKGVFRAWSLLAPAPNVERIENLYLRSDLRSATVGSYQLLTNAVAPVGSDSNANANFAGLPFFAAASSDFGHVVFESREPLTGDSPPGLSSGRVFEWNNGILRLAGILPDGSVAARSLAGQGSVGRRETPHVISADGSKIFFTVPQGSCGGFPCGALYMRLDDTTTIQLNASERTDCAGDPTCGGDNIPDPAPDPGGAQPATYWDASPDGSRVFFTTTEALTDDAPGDGSSQLYMYETTKPASDPHNLTLLSVPRQSVASNDVQGVIGAGGDGRYVYFVSTGQLVAGGPDLEGNRGIVLWHDDGTPGGSISFVGEMQDSADLVELVTGPFGQLRLASRVTPDGKHLLFDSSSGVGLTGYDHGSCPGNSTANQQCRELYVYSAATGQLACASCNPSGAPATADALMSVRTNGTGGSGTTAHLNRAISDDGTRVFFSTAEALVPDDVNGKSDVYEYNVPDHSVHLLSSGRGTSDSYFMDASANGSDVFFITREGLVGWDTDGSVDLYDARVNGGFPEPSPPPVPCVGDACHGQQGTSPNPLIIPSAFTTGHGNVSSSPRAAKPASCKRGFVRKKFHGKTKCVKRRSTLRRKGHGKRRSGK